MWITIKKYPSIVAEHYVVALGPQARSADLIVITLISGMCRWQECVWSVFLNKDAAAPFLFWTGGYKAAGATWRMRRQRGTLMWSLSAPPPPVSPPPRSPSEEHKALSL